MKKKLIAFLSLILFLTISLQLLSQQAELAIKMRGTGEDIVSSITHDNLGNIVATGKFMSTIHFDNNYSLKTAPGQFDGFVVKYDGLGKLKWVKEFGSTLEDAGVNVACDKEGNTYIAGYFRSKSFDFGPITLSGEGIDKAFIAKISTGGKVVWAKTITEGIANSKPVGIAVNNGIVFLSVTFDNGDILIGDKTFKNLGKTDIFFAAYSAIDGNLKWAETAGRIENDYAETVAVDQSGNCYLSGRSYAIYGDDINIGSHKMKASNNYNSFIAKFDMQGKFIWAKQMKGKGGVYIDGIDVSDDGDIYTCGFHGKGVHTIIDTLYSSKSEGNQFLTKISADGKQKWVRNYQFETLGRINGIDVDKNSNCYIGGFLGGRALFDTIMISDANSSMYKNFICKVSTDGKVLMARSIGEKVNTKAVNMIAVDDLENCFVSGYFTERSTRFDDISITSKGLSDSYIIKIKTYVKPEPIIVAVAQNDSLKERIAEVTEIVSESNEEELQKQKELEAKKEAELKKQKEFETKTDADLQHQKEIEAKREAELKKAKEQQAKKEAELKKLNEEKALKELELQKELEAKNAAEIKKQKEQEAKKAAEQKKQREQEAIQADELKKQQEQEARKAAEIKKQQELEIKKAAELKKQLEIDAKKAKELQKQKEIEKAKELKQKEAVVTNPENINIVFPNPTTGVFYINLPANTKSLIIRDSGGSFVYHDFKLYAKPTQIEINLGGNTGTFDIEITTKDGKKINKEIIKN
ncbi:hypothetical protein ACFLQ5_01890 [Bacteroidota bacterium]